MTSKTITGPSSHETDRAKGGMVVGLDGTPDASSALRWAEAHIDLFGPIRPVLAWHFPAYVWLGQPFGPAAPPAATMQAAAESAAQSCIELLDPDHVVDPVVSEGDAGPILVDVSADAELLVVGARGLGAVRSFLLGSVGRYCADHTKVPLVIVPEMGDPLEPYQQTPRDIAVGVDGSGHAEDALRWAIENSRTDDTITAHIAWHYLGGLGYESYSIEAPVLENAAVEALTQAVSRVTSELGVPADRVRQSVECGDPRSVLRSLAEEVDLLVVGQRGRAGLPHLMLGSTTTSLTHHPVCATAIIPSERGPDDG